jgi:gliding motility-associated-like protein
MKTLIKLLFLNFLLIFPAVSNAQPEHMNWHFGNGVGLNFSSGNPVPFSGSLLETQESCYTVSDASGNLRFYTNGINVWDANNNLMPNGSGLLGNNSAQCFVIPKPGNPGIYYIVASDATNSLVLSGITYSEVDMSLNGGNGDVTALKNITLNGNAGEWVTAVPHANCVDTWILCHGYESNSVMTAFHVSSSGINPVPVASDLGFSIVPGIGIGILKPNPVSGQIVMTRPYMGGNVDLLDFDNATGITTIAQNLFPGGGSHFGYGIEFSRSGNRLYISEFGGGALFQYDLTAADVPATRTQIGTLSVPGELGQIQIAPNDKIYVNYNVFPAGGNFLGAINNPEALGTAASFVQNVVTFPGTSINGLPWYYSRGESVSDEPDLGNDLTVCNGEVVLDPFDSSSVSGNFLWSNGSTDSVLTVSESGTYWVTYQMGSCEVTADSIFVVIEDASLENPLDDTSGCSVFLLQSSYNTPGLDNWVWHINNGDSVSGLSFSYSFSDPGNYTVYLSAETVNGCFIESDTAQINVLSTPDADFSFDPSLFSLGEMINLTDESSGEVVSWQWEYEGEVISNDNLANLTPIVYDDIEITLTVQALNGCIDSITKIIPMNSRDLLYVPNAFTPNGDGINDLFFPVDLLGIVHEMEIYDRWGELVWKLDLNSKSWDGKYNGELVPNGIYTWQIFTLIDEVNRDAIVGHVSVAR